MKRRITFRVDAQQLQEAREYARQQGTTFNDEARKWLEDYASRKRTSPPQNTEADSYEPVRGSE
jgi:hypothetical protein